MTLEDIKAKFLTAGRRRALQSLVDDARSGRRAVASTLAGSSPAMMLASLPGSETVLVIGSDPDDAGYLYYDLTRLCGDDAAVYFPSGYRRDIRYGRVDPPSVILRTEALRRIASGDRKLRFIVTSPEALAEQVASRDDIAADTLSLRAGQAIDPQALQKVLLEKGFAEVDYVYEPGHFAVRGSIIDIFGYGDELPYRIDFFGDEIDSIRAFNIETQLSENTLQAVDIVADVDQRSSSSGQSLLRFVDPATLIAVREPDDTASRIATIAGQNLSANALAAGDIDAEALKRVIDPEEWSADEARFAHLYFTASPAAGSVGSVVEFDCSPQGLYHKNFDLIAKEFCQLQGEGYKIYVLSDNAKQFERLRAIFDDRGDKITFEGIESTLHEGFIDRDTKTCIFTDHQIFDRFHKYTLRSDRARSGKLALSIKELNALEVGDYVVHLDHGVGKFAGLLRTDVGGRMQEMIKLVYQNNDIIFVSIHSLHKLSKYRGKEGVPPKLNRIGSGQWNKLKEKTKNKLKDIARDLIQLYAKRRQEKGFAFSPDSYLQQELEASFIYEDTPDQLTATRDVKADMESDRPMDRLICGDVGFGKTEIAIRAAFKAATDGKQVAVLVPTTVLAYQHYNTFSERLRDFPVRVEYLSRARTPKQTKEILADLADGKIDIIVGTHKLIGKSVKFKDLGLLVVDEEQKFGVAVKERLKQMRTNVDTLTMSATPIPRTLQFSLMGARDLSAITTPPANRYPIVTSVQTLDDDTLAEAINFEMSRGGQVFIVNNRIEGLYQLENMVKRLVPDARTIVAHGQMPPEQLEKSIVDFGAHDYDVLLSTTIIESGIDMPRVNTIVINNAQNFGLSELHQLRGRVGRSSRKAFCYLCVPPGDALTAVARRRLQAIESFSDLGSGIHIAMQDLDIRGAGNLLGAEQSGFIADLGYETYQKILKEAVVELRTEEFPQLEAAKNDVVDTDDFVTDCVVESDLELLLPPTYVPQASERIALYQELDSIDRDSQVEAFASRLRDRFGAIPPETAELLLVPKLRRLARRLGIEKVNFKAGVMYIYFVGEENTAYYMSPMFGRLLTYLTLHPRRVKIRQNAARRSFSIANVKSVDTAVKIFEEVMNLPVS